MGECTYVETRGNRGHGRDHDGQRGDRSPDLLDGDGRAFARGAPQGRSRGGSGQPAQFRDPAKALTNLRQRARARRNERPQRLLRWWRGAAVGHRARVHAAGGEGDGGNPPSRRLGTRGKGICVAVVGRWREADSGLGRRGSEAGSCRAEVRPLCERWPGRSDQARQVHGHEANIAGAQDGDRRSGGG